MPSPPVDLRPGKIERGMIMDSYGWGSERMVIVERKRMEEPSQGFADWERKINGTWYRFMVRPEVPGAPYGPYVKVEWLTQRGWVTVHEWQGRTWANGEPVRGEVFGRA